jgi:HSP20 family protein
MKFNQIDLKDFVDLFQADSKDFVDLSQANSNHKTSCLKSRVLLSENKEYYLLDIEFPGFEREEISIEVINNTLVILASRNGLQDKNHLRKSLKNNFQIEDHIDLDNISATLKNGVLSVKLPIKQIKDNRKKITIS